MNFTQKVKTNFSPSPHSFKSNTLNSDMDISEIISNINILLPQFSNFITQFNTTINQSGVNVVTDSIGTMSIDVPKDMADHVANKLSIRIGIIDRLITFKGQEINDLLQKGIQLENNLKAENPKYVSQLAQKIQEFKILNSSYKH